MISLVGNYEMCVDFGVEHNMIYELCVIFLVAIREYPILDCEFFGALFMNVDFLVGVHGFLSFCARC